MNKKIEYKGYKIVITQDEDAPNPRQEWDNFGHMVCWHSHYSLGDVDFKGKQKEWYHSDPETFRDWLVENQKDIIHLMQLYLYDHSGITMRVDKSQFEAIDLARWDWGAVGFTYCTRTEILKNFGGKNLTKDKIEKARKLLIAEVETYDMYLTGDVWGYNIETPPPGYEYDEDDDEFVNEDSEPFDGTWDDKVDNCWGFFGYRDCLQEAKDYVDWDIEYKAEKEAERVKEIETNHMLFMDSFSMTTVG